MPYYEYRCDANGRTLEVRHGMNERLSTWGQLAAQAGTPSQTGLGRLQQGALESSNVNIVEEMVSMIETQRAYEMNSKVISTADGMMQYLNNNT